MADYLRIQHWADKCVELLGVDLTLRAAGYRLIEVGDFESGIAPSGFLPNLPAILVAPTEVEPILDDVSGDVEGIEIVLRAVAYHTFEDSQRLIVERSKRLGELASAFRQIQNDGTLWTVPSGAEYGFQFWYTKPEAWEIQAQEEDLFAGLEGYQNTFAVAVSHRLSVEARLST